VTVHKASRLEVIETALEVLGPSVQLADIFSVEGLCASLRRAAALLCPAPPRRLVDSVLGVLTPLNSELRRDDVEDALDRLIGHGDLLELEFAGGRGRLLYLGPPSYLEKRPGEFLLLGIRPNADPIVDEEALGSAVNYEAHRRSVALDRETGARALGAQGLHRISREQWAKAPRPRPSGEVVDRVRQRLEAASNPGAIGELKIIDPSRPVQYYKGRWREPMPGDDGTFVGRRPQAYSAPIWCVVQLSGGSPAAVLDLPIDPSVAPSWDEARLIQAAIDAESGNGQRLKVRTVHETRECVYDFFSPLPSWAERFLELAAAPVSKTQGALFSYRGASDAKVAVTAFLADQLWMTEVGEVESR
jgi:hypothetical protein